MEGGWGHVARFLARFPTTQTPRVQVQSGCWDIRVPVSAPAGSGPFGGHATWTETVSLACVVLPLGWSGGVAFYRGVLYHHPGFPSWAENGARVALDLSLVNVSHV